MAQPAAAPVEVPKYPSEGGGILTKEAVRRIQKDIETLSRDPPPELVDLHVNENNMSIIHFLLRGAPDTPYAKGVYVFKASLTGNIALAGMRTSSCSLRSGAGGARWSPRLTVLPLPSPVPPPSLAPPSSPQFELPTNYPWAPPKISCLTPSGRFETGKHLCATVSPPK